MKLLDIECSWCKEILEDGLMLDSVELGWKTCQSNTHLCSACQGDVNRGFLLEDPRLNRYQDSSYLAFPGEIIHIGTDEGTIFMDRKIIRTIHLKDLTAVFDDIENGRIFRTTSDQHDEVRTYFTSHAVALLAEQDLAAMRRQGDRKIEAELNAKTLPAGREANIDAVKNMLGMRHKKVRG
jgi:hypothetical protein